MKRHAAGSEARGQQASEAGRTCRLCRAPPSSPRWLPQPLPASAAGPRVIGRFGPNSRSGRWRGRGSQVGPASVPSLSLTLPATLPRWLSDKEFACHSRRCGFHPWVGKIPWRRKWQPTAVFQPGKPHGQRHPVGSSPWGHKELDIPSALTITTPPSTGSPRTASTRILGSGLVLPRSSKMQMVCVCVFPDPHDLCPL